MIGETTLTYQVNVAPIIAMAGKDVPPGQSRPTWAMPRRAGPPTAPPGWLSMKARAGTEAPLFAGEFTTGGRRSMPSDA
jgi:hypothetical protein